MQQEFRRNLPHLYKTGANYFITYRLYDSIPNDVLNKARKDFELRLKSIELMRISKTDIEQKKYNLQKLCFYSLKT